MNTREHMENFIMRTVEELVENPAVKRLPKDQLCFVAFPAKSKWDVYKTYFASEHPKDIPMVVIAKRENVNKLFSGILGNFEFPWDTKGEYLVFCLYEEDGEARVSHNSYTPPVPESKKVLN